jgi:hypothetical protein
MSGQCQSHVFFPDDPALAPQFGGCPRRAETTRRTLRLVSRGNNEASMVNSVVRLCGVCAREWDAQARDEAQVGRKINGASKSAGT